MKSIVPQQLIHQQIPSGTIAVSIYANGPEELARMIAQARRTARRELSSFDTYRLFRPLQRLLRAAEAANIHYPLGLFVTRSFAGKLVLPFPVSPLYVVAPSFHVKPVLQWLQREHPFALLHLAEDRATIYQGSMSVLKKEESIRYQELRRMDGILPALDRALLRAVSGPRTPLLLAGDEELVEQFRNDSRYRAIVEESIPCPDEVGEEELHRGALARLEPFLEKREAALLAQFYAAERTGFTAATLREVVQQAQNGNVRHLLVHGGLNIWGKIDPASGRFTYSARQPSRPEDDVLDDLSELVLRGHGSVTVLPGERMPYGSVACAVLRQRPAPAAEPRAGLAHARRLPPQIAV